ncbi:MAG: hypothetical protein V1853_05350 [bacterium]
MNTGRGSNRTSRNHARSLTCNQAARKDWYDDLREAVEQELSKNGNRALVGKQVVTLHVVVESAAIEVVIELDGRCKEVATGKKFHHV